MFTSDATRPPITTISRYYLVQRIGFCAHHGLMMIYTVELFYTPDPKATTCVCPDSSAATTTMAKMCVPVSVYVYV